MIKTLFYFLILLSMSGLLSCSSTNIAYKDSNENGLSLLYENNSELNKFISEKKWGEVYDMLAEAKEKTLRKYPLQSKRTFINQHEEVFPEPVTLKLKTISHYISHDTAITLNSINMSVKIQFQDINIDTSAVDTSYHFWKFYQTQWYLLDFEERDISDHWQAVIRKEGM